MKKTKKARRRIKIYFLVIILLLAFLSYKMYYYIPKIYNNYKIQKELNLKYDKLKDKENILSKDLIKLKDKENIAKYAREKYLYTKDGELIIKIVE